MDGGSLFRFGEFECDTVAYELRRRGRRRALARQPMEVLLLLLERPGALVSRAEIAKRLWRDSVFVDADAGIHSAVLRVRRVLGDRPESPKFIETVSGKGYRFIAPVCRIAASTPERGNPPWAPLRATVARRRALPAELTSFVGRDRELQSLRQHLAASRLVTLVGTGGVGKTRLASRLAAGFVDTFRDGVWLVDLAPVSDAQLIPEVIAARLGIRESARRAPRDALFAYLGAREILLVLDTCEHLINGCAALVENLLSVAPGLRVIATAREALRARGEVVFQVPPLPLPAAPAVSSHDSLHTYESTRLFVERAQAADVRGGMQRWLDPAAIARTCIRLDGVPLAIELAAAQVGVLTTEQIERKLEDRFRLLSGSRTAVPRQRTLEATVDWSYDLLSEEERRVFCRLSVFPSSWTLEAADRVCAGDGPDDTLDLLSRLVHKSLVTIDDSCGDERRYRFLETLRHYAEQRLQSDDGDAARDRHFDFFYTAYRDGLRLLSGPGQIDGLRRLQRDHDNIRTALDWGLSSPTRAEKGIELATALIWFWVKRGLFEEGRRWLERALSLAGPGVLRARALMGREHMHFWQGRDNDSTAMDEALALGRKHGDPWSTSFALFARALVDFDRADFDSAARLARAAREADVTGEAVPNRAALLVLGNVALVTGEPARALDLFDESIGLHRQFGDAWGLSILLSLAAGLRLQHGALEEARKQAAEALSLCEALDDPRGIAYGLDLHASLLAAWGDAAPAACLWGAADRVLASVGGSLVPTMSWIRAHYVPSVSAALGDEYHELIAAGRTMSIDDAIALARRERGDTCVDRATIRDAN